MKRFVLLAVYHGEHLCYRVVKLKRYLPPYVNLRVKRAGKRGIFHCIYAVFLGYAHYAPGTLVIKGVMALVAALMYEKMGRTATSRIAGGVVSEIIMVLGYFGYASLLLGKGLAAAASIPGNIFQGAVGLVVGVLLVTVLERAKVTEKLA